MDWCGATSSWVPSWAAAMGPPWVPSTPWDRGQQCQQLCARRKPYNSHSKASLCLKPCVPEAQGCGAHSPLLAVAGRSPGAQGALQWGLGMAPILSLPPSRPWWEKTGQSLLWPHSTGPGDLSCHPRGGGGGGRNAEKGWRNAPGCASRRVGGKTSAGARSPLPEGRSQGEGSHPHPPSDVPIAWPQNGAKKPALQGLPFPPCLHSQFSPGFPRQRGCHQRAMQPPPSAPQHSRCCWGTSVLGDTSVPRTVPARRRAMAPGCLSPCLHRCKHAMWLQKKKPE